MNLVYLSLGSNLGNKELNLLNSIKLLSANDKIKVINCSDIYMTEPWGVKDQPDFLNMVLKLETALSAEDLLMVVKRIEKKLFREDKLRWGPRIIDIDLLIYNDVVINTSELVIPHKDFLKRRFVLIPLKDVDPNFFMYGKNIDELIRECKDIGRVELFKRFNLI